MLYHILILYSKILYHYIMFYYIQVYCIVLYCIVLYCICIVLYLYLYCIILYCIELFYGHVPPRLFFWVKQQLEFQELPLLRWTSWSTCRASVDLVPLKGLLIQTERTSRWKGTWTARIDPAKFQHEFSIGAKIWFIVS